MNEWYLCIVVFSLAFAIGETFFIVHARKNKVDFNDFLTLNWINLIVSLFVTVSVLLPYNLFGVWGALWPVYLAVILGLKWLVWRVFVKGAGRK